MRLRLRAGNRKLNPSYYYSSFSGQKVTPLEAKFSKFFQIFCNIQKINVLKICSQRPPSDLGKWVKMCNFAPSFY